MTADQESHRPNSTHPNDELIERSREIAKGTGVTADDVLAAIAEIRAEQAVRFGGLRGELEYDDDAFDVDPDIQAMFYGDNESK